MSAENHRGKLLVIALAALGWVLLRPQAVPTVRELDPNKFSIRGVHLGENVAVIRNRLGFGYPSIDLEHDDEGQVTATRYIWDGVTAHCDKRGISQRVWGTQLEYDDVIILREGSRERDWSNLIGIVAARDYQQFPGSSPLVAPGTFQTHWYPHLHINIRTASRGRLWRSRPEARSFVLSHQLAPFLAEHLSHYEP